MAKDSIKVTIDNKKLNKQIAKALKRNPQQTVKAVKTIAIDLSGKSARRAPIESGDLRNNCSAELNGKTIFKNEETIGAAVSSTTKAVASVGYSLPYAPRQHEELKYNHKRTDGYVIQSGINKGVTVNMTAGGEAKYLENPYNENESKYIALMEKVPEESLK